MSVPPAVFLEPEEPLAQPNVEEEPDGLFHLDATQATPHL